MLYYRTEKLYNYLKREIEILNYDYLKRDFEKRKYGDLRIEIENLFPLLNYSVTYWTAHAEVVEAQWVPQDNLLELFRWPPNNIIESCIRYHNNIKPNSTPGFEEEITFLYIASGHGLLSIIEAMIRKSVEAFDINSKDGRGQTPIFWAARYGKEAVI